MAVSILNELYKKGVRKSLFDFDCTFTQEELDSITELNITGINSLEGIENLKNLKILRLLGANLDNFSITKTPNNITDFSCLKRLKSLENLVIWHDNNIKSLDIRGLKLKNLTLISNHNLIEIKGIDEMSSLERIYVVGSSITNIGDPLKYISSTKNAKENILDLKMYNPIFHERKVGSKLTTKDSNVRFAEQVHFYDKIYTFSLEQIRELNRIARNIIFSLDLNNKSDYEIAYEIYKYIIQNVQYDYDGLEYREKHFDALAKEDKEYAKMIFINTSLSALKNKKSVCDGYVNAIIYLLNLAGIKALPVLCANKDGSLHTAIKILIDEDWIYADPERDSSDKKMCYFNLTREELAKRYTIAPREYLDHLDGGNYVKRFV